MASKRLSKPTDHSMAHHLVTYAANNMIAPLIHAQIARDGYESLLRERDEAVALLRTEPHGCDREYQGMSACCTGVVSPERACFACKVTAFLSRLDGKAGAR